MKSMVIGGVSAVGLTAILWASIGVSQNASPLASVIPYADESSVRLGEAVYNENCASCHGDELQGEPNWQTRKDTGRLPAPPHDETGHTWHHRDELLIAITKFGLAKLTNNPDYQTDMPIYDGVLEDQEILAALAYIKSKWPAEIQLRHDAMNEPSK